MQRNLLLVSFFALFIFTTVRAQKSVTSSAVAPVPMGRIAFWNVENLFDTIDDPHTDDAEFLPNGMMQWTSGRYITKINNLAKVILAMGSDGKGPDLLGMSEIENEGVLVDLTQKTDLKKINYGIVHYDSPDKRGIDVALIYKKDKFRVITSKAVPVHLADSVLTRDILVVEGVFNKKDTLYICVNHWPSRRGGKDASEDKRITAAKTLLGIADSIMKLNAHAKILAIGDFNDEPTDASLMSVKCNTWMSSDAVHAADSAKTWNVAGMDKNMAWMGTGSSACFTDLMDSLKAAGDGSFHYKDEKDMIDQFLVNDNLLHKKGIQIQHATIFRPDWITGVSYKNDPPGPLHTYAGKKYIGGYSDHYPVYADVMMVK